MTNYSIPLATSPDYFDFAELVGEFIEPPRTMLRLTNSIVDKVNEIVAREVDEVLEDASHPFRSIIAQQEEELASVYGQLHAQQDKRDDLHEVLVNVCRNSPTVLGYVRESKKINAIKELRRLTSASLRSTKEAVEDPRVVDAAGDPWGQVTNVGTEQPPGWAF
jgi:ribosomal protein L7/L12